MREERVYKDRHGQWVKESIDEYGRCRREIYGGRRTRRSTSPKVTMDAGVDKGDMSVVFDSEALKKQAEKLKRPINAITVLTGVKYF